jgi:hypothetical protein
MSYCTEEQCWCQPPESDTADPRQLLTPIDASGRPAVAEGCISSGDFFKLRMARSYGKDEGAQSAQAVQMAR